MRRHGTVILAALSIATVVAVTAGPSPQQEPEIAVFRGRVQLVEIDARVTDRDGRAIRDLTKDDFTILEDGQAQVVESASFVDLEIESPIRRMSPGAVEPDVATNAGTGRTWVMLLGGQGEQARYASRTFIEEALGPNDQVAVINVHGTMSSAQPFTRNRETLLTAVNRLGAEPTNPGLRPTQTAYRVLEEVCQRLGLVAGRKAVLFFDPPAFFSVSGPPPVDADGRTALNNDTSDYLDQRDAMRAATRNNVAVYVISTARMSPETVGGSGGTSSLAAMAGQRLLADETGGEAIVNSNDLTSGYQRFVRDSNQYYLLAYAPRVEHRDGDFHSVTVRVNRPGATVRARRGYYAPRENRRAADRPSAPVAAKGLSRAALDTLRMPLTMNGLTIDLFAAPFRAPDGRATVLVGAQVHGAGLTLSRGERMEVGFVGTNSEGRTSPGTFHIINLQLLDNSRKAVESVGLPFVDRLRLAAGRHQVRFVAHQPNGRTGTVIADVDVPKFDAPVSLSGLVLGTNLALPQTALRHDAEMTRLLAGAYPTAVRRFSRADTLTAYAEVYNNGKVGVDETIVTIAPAAQPRARRLGLATIAFEPRRTGYRTRFPLRDFEAGDYILTFQARAGQQTAARRVLFTVF